MLICFQVRRLENKGNCHDPGMVLIGSLLAMILMLRLLRSTFPVKMPSKYTRPVSNIVLKDLCLVTTGITVIERYLAGHLGG